MKASHVVFASGTALAGVRAFVFSLTEKKPRSSIWAGFYTHAICLSLGGPPSCVQSLRGVWVLSQGQKNGWEACKKEGWGCLRSFPNLLFIRQIVIEEIAVMCSLDSQSNNNYVFRVSDVPHVAINSVHSFWQGHRLAWSTGKMSLRAGTDCNNNPPPGKIEVTLSPLLWVSPQTSACSSPHRGGRTFGLPGCN